MEYIKNNLLLREIDISDIDEIAKMFEFLGNQQEKTKVFAQMNKYLDGIESGFSIWEYNKYGDPELVWMKEAKERRDEFSYKKDVLKEHKKMKKPIFEQEQNGIYAILPIVSREENIGFLCVHDEVEMGEEWKGIYVVTTMLSFIFKYYSLIEKTKELTTNDMTTGLFNMRHFVMLLGLEVDKVERFKKPLTMVVLKIKDFGMMNEKLGFDNAEKILVEFTKTMKRFTRNSDMPSRIGDDTFALLLYDAKELGGYRFVERLEDNLKKFPVSVNDDISLVVEIESNVLEYTKEMTANEFFEMAREL